MLSQPGVVQNKIKSETQTQRGWNKINRRETAMNLRPTSLPMTTRRVTTHQLQAPPERRGSPRLPNGGWATRRAPLPARGRCPRGPARAQQRSARQSHRERASFARAAAPLRPPAGASACASPATGRRKNRLRGRGGRSCVGTLDGKSASCPAAWARKGQTCGAPPPHVAGLGAGQRGPHCHPPRGRYEITKKTTTTT